jgi:hypothetical protein
MAQVAFTGKTATFYLLPFGVLHVILLAAPLIVGISHRPLQTNGKLPFSRCGNTAAKINPSKFVLAGLGFFPLQIQTKTNLNSTELNKTIPRDRTLAVPHTPGTAGRRAHCRPLRWVRRPVIELESA